MASSAATTVRDIASSTTSVARKAAGTTADAGLDAASAVRDTAFDLTDKPLHRKVSTLPKTLSEKSTTKRPCRSMRKC
jgi:hypothetical protein